MKICIAGKNAIAINTINYLLHNLKVPLDDILICVNKNDLGVNTWQPSLKLFATQKQLNIINLKELYNLKNLYFFSLEFDRIIKPNFFDTNNLYNIHFSLLPSYKGMYTSVMPILNGEQYSGVTLHRIDEGIDTGSIIDQLKFDIKLNDTARDLYFKYLFYADKLFRRNIVNLLNNNFISKPQSHINSSYYSKDTLDFDNPKIEFNKTSFQIHNQIRAFIFKEYQLPVINGKEIKKSILTNEVIEKNVFSVLNQKIILSGIDGYKIILKIND